MTIVFVYDARFANALLPDLGRILPAMSKQKSTISKEINGTTVLIILIARKYLFMTS